MASRPSLFEELFHLLLHNSFSTFSNQSLTCSLSKIYDNYSEFIQWSPTKIQILSLCGHFALLNELVLVTLKLLCISISLQVFITQSSLSMPVLFCQCTLWALTAIIRIKKRFQFLRFQGYSAVQINNTVGCLYLWIVIQDKFT